MTHLFTNIAIGLYSLLIIYAGIAMFSKYSFNKGFWILASLATSFHLLGAVLLIVSNDSGLLNLSFNLPLITAVTGVIILISSIRAPLHSIYLLLSPIALASILISSWQSKSTGQPISPIVGIHVSLAILAFSMYIFAVLQALLLAYQQRSIKRLSSLTEHWPQNSIQQLLPALDSMHLLLLNLIRAAFILLSVTIISGFIFLSSMFEPQLVHKTVFALMAWLVCLLILGREYISGWKTQQLVQWVLAGFCLLSLSYIGGKLITRLL